VNRKGREKLQKNTGNSKIPLIRRLRYQGKKVRVGRKNIGSREGKKYRGVIASQPTLSLKKRLKTSFRGFLKGGLH